MLSLNLKNKKIILKESIVWKKKKSLIHDKQGIPRRQNNNNKKICPATTGLGELVKHPFFYICHQSCHLHTEYRETRSSSVPRVDLLFMLKKWKRGCVLTCCGLWRCPQWTLQPNESRALYVTYNFLLSGFIIALVPILPFLRKK